MTKQIMFDRILDCGIPGTDWGSGKLTPQKTRAALVLDDMTIIIIGINGIVYASHNNGANWSTGPLIEAGDFRTLDILPNGKLITACDAANNFYLSDDQGASWENLSQIPATGLINKVLALHDNSILAFANNGTDAADDCEIYTSNDQGKTWNLLSTLGLGGGYTQAVQFSTGEILVTSTSTSHFYISTDYGETWTLIKWNSRPVAGFYGLCRDRETGYLYASEYGSNRIFISQNGALSWQYAGKVSTGTDVGPLVDAGRRLYAFTFSNRYMYRSRYSQFISTVYPTYKPGYVVPDLTSKLVIDSETGEVIDRLLDQYKQNWGPIACYTIAPGDTWYLMRDVNGNNQFYIKNSRTGRKWMYWNGISSTDYSDSVLWMDSTGFYIMRKYFHTSPSRCDLIKYFYSDFSYTILNSQPGYTSTYYSDNNGLFLCDPASGSNYIVAAPGKSAARYSTYLWDFYGWGNSGYFYQCAWDNGLYGYSLIFSRAAKFNATSGILDDTSFFGRPTKILSRNGEFFDIVTPRYSQFGTPREQLVIEAALILPSGLPILLVYDGNALHGGYSIYAPKNRYGGFGYMLELFLNEQHQNNLINFHRPVSVVGKYKS